MIIKLVKQLKPNIKVKVQTKPNIKVKVHLIKEIGSAQKIPTLEELKTHYQLGAL